MTWIALPLGEFKLANGPLYVVRRGAWYLDLSKHGPRGRLSRTLDGPFETPEEAQSAAEALLTERRERRSGPAAVSLGAAA